MKQGRGKIWLVLVTLLSLWSWSGAGLAVHEYLAHAPGEFISHETCPTDASHGGQQEQPRHPNPDDQEDCRVCDLLVRAAAPIVISAADRVSPPIELVEARPIVPRRMALRQSIGVHGARGPPAVHF